MAQHRKGTITKRLGSDSSEATQVLYRTSVDNGLSDLAAKGREFAQDSQSLK